MNQSLASKPKTATITANKDDIIIGSTSKPNSAIIAAIAEAVPAIEVFKLLRIVSSIIPPY